MSMNTLARAFLRVEIFQGLKPLQMTEIARHADRIIFQPGETIIENGQPGETAFLIVTGQAVREHAQTDHPNSADIIPEGSLIGEMMMLVDSVHTAKVVARTEIRALGINRNTMRQLMLADREIAEHFVAKITGRLSKLANTLRDIDQTLKSDHCAAFDQSQQANPAVSPEASVRNNPDNVNLEGHVAIH
ncbi:MAG: cyclic nucleotide-binding domain-containing protein [Hyphomicrobiaceae bacterium]